MTKALRLLIATIILAAASTTLSAQTWDVLMKKGEQAEHEQDHAAALNHYLSAARLGAEVGMNAAGIVYLIQEDYSRAFLWCTVAGLSHAHATNFSCLMQAERRLKPAEIKALNDLARQCLASRFTSCEQIDASRQGNIEAYQAAQCIIADPTGSPLNVRTGPNGKVVQTLENGISVRIVSSTADSQGREWSRIESTEGGMVLGWAFKPFLKCGSRRGAEAVAAQGKVVNAVQNGSLPYILEVLPTSNRSPAGEKVENAFDQNPNTKYLNFDKLNAGFTVHLSQRARLDSLQLTTANDFVGRDPTSMTVRGSNDGRTWRLLLSDMPISLPSARKTKGALMFIPSPDAFEYYQVIFPTVKNMDRTCGRDCDSVQIADVDLNYK
jgi:hypothetical protein